ncbi:MAG: hypothetical protein LUE86_09975 [Clostridiales bacterium]|nr:hypothetical protein [Clostridiales bacterium]
MKVASQETRHRRLSGTPGESSCALRLGFLDFHSKEAENLIDLKIFHEKRGGEGDAKEKIQSD